MSNALAIELHALAERTTDGSGDAEEIGALRSAVDLYLLATEVAAGTQLELVVETSPDGSTGWRRIGALVATGPSRQRGTYDGCEAYVRVSWNLSGDCTFQVVGQAHTLYAQPEDLQDALPNDVYEQADASVLVRSLIKATSHVAHRVGGAHPLPLTAWTPALVEATASMAAFYVLKKHQLEGGGVEELVKSAYAQAIEWLKEVQRGEVKQAETTPEQELGARIVSGNPDEPETFRARMSDDWGDFG